MRTTWHQAFNGIQLLYSSVHGSILVSTSFGYNESSIAALMQALLFLIQSLDIVWFRLMELRLIWSNYSLLKDYILYMYFHMHSVYITPNYNK